MYILDFKCVGTAVKPLGKYIFFIHDINGENNWSSTPYTAIRHASNGPTQNKKKEFLVTMKPITFTRNTKFHINSLSQISFLFNSNH